MNTFIILAESAVADACDVEDTPFNIVVRWHNSLGNIGNEIIDTHFQIGWETSKEHRKAMTDRLSSIATNAAIFLLDLDVEDPAAAFVAEWERAAVKHPGMTLDADGHTDESRFYALAEEVGEVAASLTYDNANSTGHGADTIAEVTQVGALALAWLVRYQDGAEQ